MKPKRVAIAASAIGVIVAAVASVSIMRNPLLERWYRWTGATDSEGTPRWLSYHRFDRQGFEFVRIRYGSVSPRRGGGAWMTDYPDADVNLSARLREVTSLEVGEGRVLSLTDEELAEHPFVYMAEGGRMGLSKEERVALRRYLLKGGFLMVDDFWGADEWENVYHEMQSLFPDREPEELPLEHEIFHCVFDLDEKPQVCSINHAYQGRQTGTTWERPDAKEPHYKAITDDDGRVMVLLCHNTDLGDGWERTDEDAWYYEEFSKKRAFPMGINIIYFALTQ